jgi:hypothetical protein
VSGSHFDLAGQEILPGSFIVYSALWDRSAVLKYGIITRLAVRKNWRAGDPDIVTLRAITVDRKWGQWGRGAVSWELQKKGGETTLGFTDRTLVVPESSVPAAARDLLRLEFIRHVDALVSSGSGSTGL